MGIVNLKLHGLLSADDLKMAVGNCRTIDGVKPIKAVYRPDVSELVLELEKDSLREQVVEMVRLSGDIKIEGLDEKKKTNSTPKESGLDNGYYSKQNVSKRYFINGLLFGFLAISLLLNIIMAYIIFRK